MTEISVIIIGSIASIIMVIAGLTTHRKRLFTLATLISLLSLTQFLILGTYAAMVIGIISATRNFSLAFLEEKFPKINTPKTAIFYSLLHTLAFTLTTNVTSGNTPIYEFLPLTGAIIGTLAPLFNRMVLLKTFMVFSGLSWLTFELIKGAYGQAIGETFTLFANLTAIVYLTIQHRKLGNVDDETIEDLSTQIIHVVTTPIDIIKPITEALTRPIPIQER